MTRTASTTPATDVRGAVREALKIPASEWPVRFKRKGACEYLKAQHDMDLSPAGLSHIDMRGAGPKRSVILKKTYYRRIDLDAWVESLSARGERTAA